jgi:hypothetical protein
MAYTKQIEEFLAFVSRRIASYRDHKRRGEVQAVFFPFRDSKGSMIELLEVLEANDTDWLDLWEAERSKDNLIGVTVRCDEVHPVKFLHCSGSKGDKHQRKALKECSFYDDTCDYHELEKDDTYYCTHCNAQGFKGFCEKDYYGDQKEAL